MARVIPVVRPRGNTCRPVLPRLTFLTSPCVGEAETSDTSPRTSVELTVRPTMEATQTTEVEDGLVLVLPATSAVLVMEARSPQRSTVLLGIGPVPFRNALT